MMRGELQKLLAAAVDLMNKGAAAQLEHLTVGDKRFHVVTHEADRGWIMILLQDAAPSYEEMLKARYGLTQRQIDVALLLAERYSNREIAEQLGITPYTVGRHVEQVLRKLGVCTRKAVRAKLVTK